MSKVKTLNPRPFAGATWPPPKDVAGATCPPSKDRCSCNPGPRQGLAGATRAPLKNRTHRPQTIFEPFWAPLRPFLSFFWAPEPFLGFLGSSRTISEFLGFSQTIAFLISHPHDLFTRRVVSGRWPDRWAGNPHQSATPTTFSQPSLGESYRDAGPIDGQRYPFGNPNQSATPTTFSQPSLGQGRVVSGR